MTRPSLKDTSDWRTAYESPTVTIESATLKVSDGLMQDGAFRVTVHEHQSHFRRGPDGGFVLVPKRSRLFYGESAWSDAQRMAQDVDPQAIV